MKEGEGVMRYEIARFLRKAMLLGVAVACLLLPGCNSGRQSARDDQKKVEPVSETAPKFEPLRPEAPAVVARKPVPSSGDCAPKYANGLTGSCINNQPCRGFGVLAEDGKTAVCACYARAGGCNKDERCDVIRKACVPEKEPGFGRLPSD
jgi:hypothetical protein